MTKLVVESSMVEFFRPDTDVYQSDNFIRKYFGGTTQVTVAVEADTTERLLSPDVLCAVDNLGSYLTERVPEVSKVTGFTDMVKRMNQMFNVDESPDGIQPIRDTNDTNLTNEDEGDVFGFGDFGDLGFEEEGPRITQIDTDYDSNISENPRNQRTYSFDDMFSLFESAVAKNTGMSAREVLREMQRQTNYEGRAYYEIPSDPARYGKTSDAELEQLIANYLVLVGGDNDGGYSNDPLEPTAIRSVIQVNSKWWADTKTVIEKVNNYVAANFPPDVRVIVGGSAVVIGELSTQVVNSQIVSIVISILVVILILALANKSIMAGILGAVPLSIAIVCNFGLMGFLGITLNMGTALVSSLAVGIGIDYTIHFMEFFKREYQAGGDYVQRTFAGCGKAILINAVSVGAGFGVLALSQFRMIAHLGGLIASSMFISAILSLTLMPVLFLVFKPRFIFGKQARSA
jgi:predicted RND superfamily exporter protein